MSVDDNSLPSAVVDEAFQNGDRAYNAPEHNPWEFETRIEAELDWEPPSLNCFGYNETGKHDWNKIPAYAHPDGYEYEFCPDCGSRRQYDNQIGRFVYDHDGILTPEVRASELRDVVIPHTEVANDFDDWECEHGGPESFESGLARKPEVAPCRGPLGIHEWDEKEIIEEGIGDGRSDVVLWECRNCPAHLLTNFSCHGEVKAHILFGKEPNPEWGLSHLNGNPRLCSFQAHKDNQNWDYCSMCFQSNP